MKSLLLLLLALSPVWADVVVLKDGRRLTGTVREQGGELIIKSRFGSTRVKRSQVLRIERRPSEPGAVGKEKAEAAPDGLKDEPVEPGHSKTKPSLPPCAKLPTKRRESLLRVAGKGARLLSSDHFVLATAVEGSRPKEWLALLEQVYERFDGQAKLWGFELRKPPCKLEVVFFANQKSFQEFTLFEHHRMIGSDGFFSRPDNRSYFYDFLNSRASAKALAIQRGVLKEIKELEQRRLTAPLGQRMKLGQQIRQRRKALRDLARRQSALLELTGRTTAAHEVLHQLTFSRGLIPELKGFPAWLNEGLALIFEELPQRKARQRGQPLGTHNELRVRLLKAARKEGVKTISVRRLLGCSGSLLDEGGATTYAVTWALMHQLLVVDRERTAGRLGRFLGAVNELCVERAKEDKRVTAEERRALFRMCFGVELKAFARRFEKTLKDLSE